MTANERLAEIKAELARITDSWGLLDPDLKPYQLQISALVGSNTVLVGALGAVLELHQHFEYSDSRGDGAGCNECRYDDGSHMEYPCPTVEAISEALRS